MNEIIWPKQSVKNKLIVYLAMSNNGVPVANLVFPYKDKCVVWKAETGEVMTVNS